MTDNVSAAQLYLQYKQQGMSAADAFKKAWPNGIPTAQDRAKDASKQQQSSALAQIAGLVGGSVGAKYLISALGKEGAKEVGKEVAKEAVSQGTQQVAQQTAANGVSGTGVSGIPSAAPTGAGPGGVPLSGAPGETVTPQLPGAETAGSSWTTAPANGSIGQIAGAAAALKGGYDAQRGWENGGEGLRSGLTEAGGGVGSIFGGPAGAAIGATYGNAIGYGLQGHGWKNQLALALTTGGLGNLAVAAGFGPHQTTRQNAQVHTKDLLNTGKDDATWQNYLTGMRGQFNAPPPDKAHPFAGKYASWDEYKKAGLQSDDLTGVYGNLKTFGPDWAHLSFDQQKAVTQGLIDKGLYDSKKGEVVITDPNAAKSVYSQVLASGGAGTTQKAVTTQPTTAVNPKLAAALNKQDNDAKLAQIKVNLGLK